MSLELLLSAVAAVLVLVYLVYASPRPERTPRPLIRIMRRRHDRLGRAEHQVPGDDRTQDRLVFDEQDSSVPRVEFCQWPPLRSMRARAKY